MAFTYRVTCEGINPDGSQFLVTSNVFLNLDGEKFIEAHGKVTDLLTYEITPSNLPKPPAKPTDEKA